MSYPYTLDMQLLSKYAVNNFQQLQQSQAFFYESAQPLSGSPWKKLLPIPVQNNRKICMIVESSITVQLF